MRKWTVAVFAIAVFMFLTQAYGSAQDGSLEGLEARVEKVLENQEKILTALGEIKKELQVVKIRATRK